MLNIKHQNMKISKTHKRYNKTNPKKIITKKTYNVRKPNNLYNQIGVGRKISKILVIEQTPTSFTKPNNTEDIIIYDTSIEKYCNTDIQMDFELHHLKIPTTNNNVGNRMNHLFNMDDENAIQKKVLEKLNEILKTTVMLDEDVFVLYKIFNYYDEYQFNTPTGDMVINFLLTLNDEIFWKEHLDIYVSTPGINLDLPEYTNINTNIDALTDKVHKIIIINNKVKKYSKNSGITLQQHLNLRRRPEYPKSLRNIKSGKSTLTFNEIRKTGGLVCQDWFIYFIETITKCVEGRLMQFAGTCYINVGLNSFILGEGLKYLVLKKLFEKLNIGKYGIEKQVQQVHRDKILEFIAYLETEIDAFTCEKQDKMFIFRYIYQIVLKKTKFTYKELAPRINSVSALAKTVFKNNTTAEGFADVLESKGILSSTKMLDALLKYAGLNTFLLRKNIFAKNETTGKYKIPGVINNGFGNDNILVFYNGSSKYFFSNIFDDIPLVLEREPKYKFDTAIIYIYFGPGKPSHVVLGFICNGIPKIFDSNGYILTLDWIEMFKTDVNPMKDLLINYFTNVYGQNSYSFGIQSLLYVKESSIKKTIPELTTILNNIIDAHKNNTYNSDEYPLLSSL